MGGIKGNNTGRYELKDTIGKIIGRVRMDGKKWWQSKAVWTGITAIVTTLGGYAAGEISLVAAVQSGFVALMGIFIRTGVGTPITAGNGNN